MAATVSPLKVAYELREQKLCRTGGQCTDAACTLVMFIDAQGMLVRANEVCLIGPHFCKYVRYYKTGLIILTLRKSPLLACDFLNYIVMI